MSTHAFNAATERGTAPSLRFKLLALLLTLCLPPVGGVVAAIGAMRALRAHALSAAVLMSALVVVALGWLFMLYALANATP